MSSLVYNTTKGTKDTKESEKKRFASGKIAEFHLRALRALRVFFWFIALHGRFDAAVSHHARRRTSPSAISALRARRALRGCQILCRFDQWMLPRTARLQDWRSWVPRGRQVAEVNDDRPTPGKPQSGQPGPPSVLRGEFQNLQRQFSPIFVR